MDAKGKLKLDVQPFLCADRCNMRDFEIDIVHTAIDSGELGISSALS